MTHSPLQKDVSFVAMTGEQRTQADKHHNALVDAMIYAAGAALGVGLILCVSNENLATRLVYGGMGAISAIGGGLMASRCANSAKEAFDEGVQQTSAQAWQITACPPEPVIPVLQAERVYTAAPPPTYRPNAAGTAVQGHLAPPQTLRIDYRA